MSGIKLAKYDFRSKQDYIYKTNKVKEIVGASEIITRAYYDFFEALDKKGIFADYALAVKGECPHDMPCAFDNGLVLRYINNPDCTFHTDIWETQDETVPGGKKQLSGKVIYIGGGNLYMLWKGEQAAMEASGVLCRMLREKAYSLSAVCGMADYTGDYSKDMKALNIDFERCKVLAPPFIPCAMLPFTEMDRRTSLPIAHKSVEPKAQEYMIGEESISRESLLKRIQYHKTHGNRRELMDDMVTGKGRESLLAVIYIDGNNMGVRIRNKMNPDGKTITDYSTGVREIRRLSNAIQNSFVTKPRDAINDRIYEALKEKKYGSVDIASEQMSELRNEADKRVRWIVSGGDEITLVCNARDVLLILEAYFKELTSGNADRPPEGKNTACAGVAVFHSHFPFSKAYEIAEECCESAKEKNRMNGSGNCIVDFQYIYSGVTGDLELMRRPEKDKLARPYLIAGAASGVPSMKEDFIKRADRLRAIGRANLKTLSAKLFDGDKEYHFEIERLNAQYPSVRLKANEAEDKRFVLDIAQFYDIWFSKEAE